MWTRPFYELYELINSCYKLLYLSGRFYWTLLWKLSVYLLDHDWNCSDSPFTTHVESRSTLRSSQNICLFQMACLGFRTTSHALNSLYWTWTLFKSWISKLWWNPQVVWISVWISNWKHLDFDMIWVVLFGFPISHFSKTSWGWGKLRQPFCEVSVSLIL